MNEQKEAELDLTVNQHDLKGEWERHPGMVAIWADKTAYAQHDFDVAKSELEILKAEIDKAVRANPIDFKISKITEKVVENAVLLSAEYKHANDILLEAKLSLNLHQAAMNGLEHRKRSLSMLVELWIRAYYADPTIQANEEMDSYTNGQVGKIQEEEAKAEARTNRRRRREEDVDV